MTHDEFFEKIYNSQNSNVLGGSVSAITEKEEIRSVRLESILNLDLSKLSEEGRIILDTLENNHEFPFFSEFQSLKWKILSLTNMQDVLTGTIYNDYDNETWAARTYFYYEGLHLLREYFYCGFNNYLSAAQHLLRTFVEFNIKQNYFDYICEERDSYAPLKKYLKDGISPSSIKMANTYLPNGEFTKPLKKKIQIILAKLSSSSSHAYRPIDSNRGQGRLQHEYSLDTVYFWISLNYTINMVLWSHYLMHPTLFRPRNIIRKFGFNYPMGVYSGEFQNACVKHTLTSEDYKLFEQHALSTQTIADIDSFYEMQPDLTDEQVLNTWDEKEDIKSIDIGYIQIVAKFRVINEMLAVRCTFNFQNNDHENLDSLLNKVMEYSWWKDNYKKF